MIQISPLRLPAILVQLLFGSAFLHVAHAQTANTANITGLSTQLTPGTPTVRVVPGVGSGSFPTNTNYTLTYTGDQLGITSFTTGVGPSATTYQPLVYGGTVTTTLVRGSSGPNNNILYQRLTAQSGTNYTVDGPYQPSQQAAFNANNLNVGTDNLFGNTGDGSGNNNNIERVDVVFSDGLIATQALAFALFERGGTNAHDGFGIAAITSVAAGTPTSFGTRISFAANSYGNSDLVPGTTDWLVIRNQATSPGGGAQNPAVSIANQAIGGTTISVTGAIANLGLGINEGDVIYGYSLFAFDVTAQGADLLDVNNATFFPSTDAGTGAGGIDLIAFTGVAFSAIPEPGTAGLVLLSLGAFTALRRKIHR